VLLNVYSQCTFSTCILKGSFSKKDILLNITTSMCV